MSRLTKKGQDRLLSISEMDVRGKTKDYPSINDYYRGAARGDKPIQYQHGLSNYSSVQLGDDRISIKKSLSQDAYRLHMEQPGETTDNDEPIKSKTLKQRKEDYAEAHAMVGFHKIHEMEQMMRDKLQQRTKTGPFQLRKTFKYFDRDGSGGIDFSEFQLAMELMGFQFTEIQQLALFARYDESCTGEVDYNDFIEKVMESDFKVVKADMKQNVDKMLTSAFSRPSSEQLVDFHGNDDEDDDSDSDLEEREVFKRKEVKKMFDYIDKDGSGYIDIAELGKLLKNLGKKYTREEINERFYRVDSDRSGHIEFDEFFEWFKKVGKEDLKSVS
jgi:Ca2+-binding EF-hand superfamily protein